MDKDLTKYSMSTVGINLGNLEDVDVGPNV